jgi:hypothetical protein
MSEVHAIVWLDHCGRRPVDQTPSQLRDRMRPLFLSIGMPAYERWAINLIPIVLVVERVITVRRER